MVKVSVVKCDEYDDKVFSAVSKALDLIDAKEIFKPGMKVLIKPNILASTEPSKAVTTHPTVIDAICRYLIDMKIKIKLFIGESSGSAAANGTAQAFKVCGIEAVAKKYNIEFINFDKDEHIIKENKKAVEMKNIVMSKRLSEMDLIIDACKLKTHMLTGYTGAIKNMFGTLPGRAKVNAHSKGKKVKTFSNILLDIYSNFPPALCIMDGIIGMEGNGPSSGKIKQTGLIIASRNAVALDKVASKIIGFKNKDLEILKLADKRNLTPKDIEIVGEKNIDIPYKKPSSYKHSYYNFIQHFIMSKLLQATFEVDKSKCKRCGYCARACPQKAIDFSKGYPQWDKKKCIMCYCCHELCPHDAIILKKTFIGKIAEKFSKRYED